MAQGKDFWRPYQFGIGSHKSWLANPKVMSTAFVLRICAKTKNQIYSTFIKCSTGTYFSSIKWNMGAGISGMYIYKALDKCIYQLHFGDGLQILATHIRQLHSTPYHWLNNYDVYN